MKVLVALSHSEFTRDITSFLIKEGYLLESATSFLTAVDKINLYEFDCIILSRDLSGGNSFEILEHITRENKTEGVIIVAKNNSMEDKIRALDLGADDYLIEPVDVMELSARIRAVIRRKRYNTKSRVYFANLIIDLHLKAVIVWSTPISLTRKEFEILLYLISNKNKVVSKNSLAEYLWGESADNYDNYESLFTHIKNLRKKLREVKAEVDFKSIYGVGYQIIEL